MVEVGCELSEMELDALCSLDDESVWNSLEESESDSIDIDLCSIAKGVGCHVLFIHCSFPLEMD